MAHGRHIRPVLGILAPRGDPAAQRLDLGRGEGLAGLRGRHALGGVFRRDPLDQRTLVRLAGHDGAGGAGGLLDVEPQVGLAMLRVRAVAGETLVRQDRADVAVEVGDRVGGAGSGGGEQEEETGGQTHELEFPGVKNWR